MNDTVAPTNEVDPNATNRHDEIVEMLRRLDKDTPLEFKPSVTDLKSALGYQISAAERDKAWAEFRPVEAPKPVPVVGGDWPQVTNKSKSPMRVGTSETILPGETKGVAEWADLKRDSYAVKKMLEAGLLAEAK